MNEILILILLTLLPALELRASIPYGILISNLNWFSVIANAILGPVVYFIIDNFIHLFQKIEAFDRIWTRVIERTQRKIHKYVERYGILGLSLFIGIPFPGSGSYTGAVGAYLLGFKMKRFAIANLIGVLIAGTIVTIAVLTGGEMFRLFLKI